MFVVGAGWGLIHLVSHLASSVRHRRSTKPAPIPATDGVWDRELDE
jgi:hypothetical protein